MSHSHDHQSSAPCTAKIDSKLARYAAVALLPTAATSVAVADTYDGFSDTPVTVNSANGYNDPSVSSGAFDSAILFTAAGLQFRAFAFHSTNVTFSHYRSAGVSCLTQGLSDVKWFGSNSASRVISAGASADNTNFGFGGWSYSSFYMANFMSEGGEGYFGFSATYTETSQTVNGWVQYSNLTQSNTNVGLTILSWAYNVDAAITMPSNQGSSTPVPGLGGLAALACGAAGMRRNRNRVA